MSLLKKLVVSFEKYASKSWYEWALAVLAGIDHFILVIPTDGLVISSTLLAPKKWLRFALLTSVGSSLGVYVLAILVHQWGLAWVMETFPSFVGSDLWAQTDGLFRNYGLWIAFLMAATPIALQPVVALAIFAQHSPEMVFAVILAGRLIKYSGLCALSRWAPSRLQRLWGVQKELEETNFNSIKEEINK